MSCPSATVCTGVGQYTEVSGRVQTIAERWAEGEWALQSAPNPGSSLDTLYSVSCTASTACTATGYSSARTAPTIARWNGTEWALQRSLDRAGSNLEGVSCFSAEGCVAVGRYPSSEALAEHWNGRAWTAGSIPNPPDPFREGHVTRAGPFRSVSCTSSTFCLAIGEYTVVLEFTEVTVPLTETWNGREWTIQPSPLHAEYLWQEVSCVSTTSCIAVGYDSQVGRLATLALQWNGSEWTRATTASPGSTTNQLLSVSCTASNACMAVGTYVERSGRGLTLGLRWNGTEWVREETPNPRDTNVLEGVSCTSATVCTAVGHQRERSGSFSTLAVRYS